MLTTASDVARSLPKRAANARLKLAVTYANHGDPAAVPLLRGLLSERDTRTDAIQILQEELTCLAPAADHAAIRAEIAAAFKR